MGRPDETMHVILTKFQKIGNRRFSVMHTWENGDLRVALVIESKVLSFVHKMLSKIN